jgi:hypothetical protein
MFSLESAIRRTAEGGVEVVPQVKVTVGVGGAVLLVAAIKKAPEFANWYYALYEHVANNRLYLAIGCVLPMCLGWTLSRPNWLRGVLVLLGFAGLPIVIVLPQTPAIRWSTPSVLILPGDENTVQQFDSSELSTLVSPIGTIGHHKCPANDAKPSGKPFWC